uniref:Uncharacterized protein n=1 Tax=Rhipicephalus zambeziensis TaxID=60191 RepID=A0A224YLA9_9ACAR
MPHRENTDDAIKRYCKGYSTCCDLRKRYIYIALFALFETAANGGFVSQAGNGLRFSLCDWRGEQSLAAVLYGRHCIIFETSCKRL